MVEKTVRAKLKKLGLNLRISTEMYTGDKCYAVMDDNGPVMYHHSLDDLVSTWRTDFQELDAR